METELDKIKSTITVSLGTKNRLRKQKGSQSYEEYINYLLRFRNQAAHSQSNVIELQKKKRKKGIYSFTDHKILFSYNSYINSRNFMFDIQLETVRHKGRKTTVKNALTSIAKATGKDMLLSEYRLYFELLAVAIRNDIEPLFKHNGRIEDHFSWKQEFESLQLPKQVFEYDVMEKLHNYNHGQEVF